MSHYYPVEWYKSEFTIPVLDDPELPLDIYYGSIPLSVFHPAPTTGRTDTIVLFLYGGSKYASRANYRPFMEMIAQYGYIVACFDWRGMRRPCENGWIPPLWETALHAHAVDAGFLRDTLRARSAIPPLFYKTGLHTRIADARAAIAFLCEKFSPRRLVVCGYSMGGYVAACVSDRRVSHMILLSPGAYHAQLRANKTSFGPEFHKVLHSSLSWTNSDSFRLIRRHEGPLCLLGFKDDVVVSRDIIHTYLYSSGAKNIHYDYLPGDHGLSGSSEKQYAVANQCLWWLASYYQ